MNQKILHVTLTQNRDTKLATDSISQSYEYLDATSIERAYELVEKISFDLILISVTYPSQAVIQFLEQLNNMSFGTKIIVVTTKTTEPNTALLLAVGADLHLKQPLSHIIITHYCRKLLQMQKYKPGALLTLGQVSLQPETAHLYLDTIPVQLRRKESDILACLFRFKNQVVTRDMLIDYVWGITDSTPEKSTIDVYVRRLRMHLRNYGGCIQTVKGIGYSARVN
ncbi:MAG: hypothetical protein COY80_00255, partial [Candidatus Pacebacteria bacterium CG_4_10_14_0_8_um_filter_42_14]